MRAALFIDRFKEIVQSGRMESSHLKWFDAARGVAAIAVLLDHSYYIFFQTTGFIPSALILAGNWAVYVFFFMSGFLITLSIKKNIERSGRFNVWQYTTSRILRIYPPLIGAILVIVIVGVVIRVFNLPDIGMEGREQYAYSFSEIITALQMRRGLGVVNGSLWSLYMEGQIYVIVGGIAGVIWSKRFASILFGSAAIVVGVYCAKDIPFFLFYAGIWFAGSLAFLLVGSRFGAKTAPPRWLMKTGDFSYSLYVMHFPLLLLCLSITKKLGLAGVSIYAAMTISVILIISFAHAFAMIFERPRELKAFLHRRWSTSQSPAQ